MNEFLSFVSLRGKVFLLIGAIGGAITGLLGGWDMPLEILYRFMVVDYVSGFAVAGIFKNSTKTITGGLQSKAGWKGLCKKGMTLCVVFVANQLELLTGSEFIRNAVIIGFISNEALSILENAGLMGIPIPSFIKSAIDILIKKNQIKQNESKTNPEEKTTAAEGTPIPNNGIINAIITKIKEEL